VPVPRRRRFAQIILVIIAACGCLALGWWQWTRFESTSGSFQNLGYALQWPMFAGFCIYAYRKFVRYEGNPPEPRPTTSITEVPEGLLPERPHMPMESTDLDPATREYNAYLAQLTKVDKAQADQTAERPADAADKQNRTTA
jgi:DNA-binding transcriptional regulator of glucitol operon